MQVHLVNRYYMLRWLNELYITETTAKVPEPPRNREIDRSTTKICLMALMLWLLMFRVFGQLKKSVFQSGQIKNGQDDPSNGIYR